MAKTTAPLLSFDGSGQVAKTLVYSRWKGVPYTRKYVVPANPNTLAQREVRKLFALLREMWKIAPVGLSEPWNAFAVGRPFTGMNKWVGENVRVLKGLTSFAGAIISPGARGGLPPQSVVINAGAAGVIDVDVTGPIQMPQGWSIHSVTAVAFPDQDPAGFFTGAISTVTDNVAPYELQFTGLEATEDYAVAAYIRYTKPDGSAAYSVATATIHAAG